MPTRQQQAEQLRAALVPYIEENGTEREVECDDGTTHRYREVVADGFVLRYQTPSHRNPQPMPCCMDQALYLQANPIEDYALTIHACDRQGDAAKGKRTTLFCGCWRGKGDTIHITACAGNESKWYDALIAVLELASKAAQSEAARP